MAGPSPQQKSNPNPSSSKPKDSPRRRRKPSRLQKRAPAAIDVTPSSSRCAENWKVAIPLLTPLVLSPVSPAEGEDLALDASPSSSSSTSESSVDNQIEIGESFMTWQHPAAPFFYESTPFVTHPFVHQCR